MAVLVAARALTIRGSIRTGDQAEAPEVNRPNSSALLHLALMNLVPSRKANTAVRHMARVPILPGILSRNDHMPER